MGVPECSNYYGDLEFQPEELVKAGVDPEAVGLKVNSAARTRTKSSSKSSNRVSNTFTEIQLPPDDDYDFDLGLRSFNTEEDLRPSLINDNRVLVPAKPLPSRFRPRPPTEATTTTTTTTKDLEIIEIKDDAVDSDRPKPAV